MYHQQNYVQLLKIAHGVKVSTVEHLLAAFYIAGVDNAIVEINCEEIPINGWFSKRFFKCHLKK